jgi:hypothetical protein
MRPERPGDVWSLTGADAHVLAVALARVRPWIGEGDVSVWQVSLEGEQPLQVTPTEWDQAFFEALLAAESARLWELDGDLDCGHSADEHLERLRDLRLRLITAPRAFNAPQGQG